MEGGSSERSVLQWCPPQGRMEPSCQCRGALCQGKWSLPASVRSLVDWSYVPLPKGRVELIVYLGLCVIHGGKSNLTENVGEAST